VADAYPIMAFICVQCGKPAARPYRGTGVKPTLCGNACKVAAYRVKNPKGYLACRQREAAKRALAEKPAPAPCPCGAIAERRKKYCLKCAGINREKALRAGREAYYASRGDVRCGDCGTPIANDGSYQRRCEECRSIRQDVARRIGRSIRKRRVRAATIERFDPIEVLRRDGWRCHMCGCKTPEAKRGTYAANAPELDHIIPLAKGGAHSKANTACSCRRCNIAKSDKVLGQPSLLAAL